MGGYFFPRQRIDSRRITNVCGRRRERRKEGSVGAFGIDLDDSWGLSPPVATTPAIFQPHGLSLERRGARKKTWHLGEAYTERGFAKKKGGVEMERKRIFKRIFFFPNIHATSLRPCKNLDRDRSRFFGRRYNRFLGQIWTARGTRVQYARAYASSGRARLVSTSGHRFKAGQSTLYRTSPSRRYVHTYPRA